MTLDPVPVPPAGPPAPTAAPPAEPLRVRAPERALVAPALIGANLLVFAAMLVAGVPPLAPQADDLLAWGANNGSLVAGGEWWRLLASAFVHVGLLHVAVNMVALRSLGVVELFYGSGAFLVLYLESALGGSVASVLSNPGGVSAGASGAIFGLAGAMLAFFLRHRRAMPRDTFRRTTGNLLLILALNVAFGLSVPNIDNGAHLGGLATGFAAGLLLDRDPEQRPRLTARRAARAAVLAVVLLALVLAIPWRVSSSPRVRAQTLVERAAEARSAEDWGRVLALASEAIAVDPREARAYELRGSARASLGDLAPAREDLDRALDLEPRLVLARVLRARLRWELGDAKGADEDLDRLIGEGQSVEGYARMLRAMVALTRGDAEGALVDLRVAEQEDQGDSAVRLLAWICRLELGEGEAVRAEARALHEEVRAGRAEFEDPPALALLAGAEDARSFLDGRRARSDDPQVRAGDAFLAGAVLEHLESDPRGAREAYRLAAAEPDGGPLALLARARL